MIHARLAYQTFQDLENEIPEDEPVMLFRAKGKHFIKVLQFYAVQVKKGTPIETAIYQHIELAEKWVKNNKVKEPRL